MVWGHPSVSTGGGSDYHQSHLQSHSGPGSTSLHFITVPSSRQAWSRTTPAGRLTPIPCLGLVGHVLAWI